MNMFLRGYALCFRILQVIVLQIYMKICLTQALELVGCRRQPLSVDEEIASAYKVSNLNYLHTEKTRLTELDMMLTEEQYKAFYPNLDTSDGSRSKRRAVKGKTYRWKDKTIPYKISQEDFTRRQRKEIKYAMSTWSHYTCVQFVPATTHESYVNIVGAPGCYSSVGYVGNRSIIGLSNRCRLQSILHELGHTLGFIHEHMRPNRDNYIAIMRDNVEESALLNFRKCPQNMIDNYSVPYDYKSLMHYGGTYFSKNGNITIKTLDHSMQDVIGQRSGLSFNDIKLANLMYSCHEKCTSTQVECLDPGFVGKDCKCYCPGNPIQVCSEMGNTTAESPTPKEEKKALSCRDVNPWCKRWAMEGKCSVSQYMRMYCRKSCKLCVEINGYETPIDKTATAASRPPCMDKNGKCKLWGDRGHCSRFREVMEKYCARTCTGCGAHGRLLEESGSLKTSVSFWKSLNSLVVVYSILWSLIL